jgi:prepilin-type processing-associated H-X9-DG protein
MALAINTFQSGFGHYPTGGTVPWPAITRSGGAGGAPVLGANQEAGWAFQILPFIEQDATFKQPDDNVIFKSVVPIYSCPARRGPTVVKYNSNLDHALMDYAAAVPGTGIGQSAETTMWQGGDFTLPADADYNGVIVRAKTKSGLVTPARIDDGLSNTLVFGEKQLQTPAYNVGDWHDDRGWSDGWDPDVLRVTVQIPLQDAPSGVTGYRFGSAHQQFMNCAFADGSVHPINYSIGPMVFNALGHRRDGRDVNNKY